MVTHKYEISRVILIIWIMIFFNSCGNMKVLGSLSEVNFKIDPYISVQDDTYLLVFQVESTKNNLEFMTDFKILDESIVFFIRGKTSMPPYLGLRKIEIKDNRVKKLVDNGEVYWLNKDESTIRIPVKIIR